MSVKSNPTGATVVLVDGGGEAEAAGEEARGGVDAHDLRDDRIEHVSIGCETRGKETQEARPRGSLRLFFFFFKGSLVALLVNREQTHTYGNSYRSSRKNSITGEVVEGMRGDSRCSRGSRWTSPP